MINDLAVRLARYAPVASGLGVGLMSYSAMETAGDALLGGQPSQDATVLHGLIAGGAATAMAVFGVRGLRRGSAMLGTGLLGGALGVGVGTGIDIHRRTSMLRDQLQSVQTTATEPYAARPYEGFGGGSGFGDPGSGAGGADWSEPVIAREFPEEGFGGGGGFGGPGSSAGGADWSGLADSPDDDASAASDAGESGSVPSRYSDSDRYTVIVDDGSEERSSASSDESADEDPGATFAGFGGGGGIGASGGGSGHEGPAPDDETASGSADW